MAARSHTPQDFDIRPRDMAFGRTEAPTRRWLNGDPVASAVFDALSVTFPQGERFFMDSVRRFRDGAPPPLKAQIAAFLAQEAMHTREHIVFNQHLASQGHDFAAMEARSKALLDEAREQPDYIQLATTVALEHFTAILGHLILANPKYLAGAEPEAARLWRWHAMEEVEHKAVAYDTLVHILQGVAPRRRWLLRSAVMWGATVRFLNTINLNALQILVDDGFEPKAAQRAIWRYLLVSPGAARQVLPLYLEFFLPGFHPWRRDDRNLLRQAEQDMGVTAAAAPTL
jgi:uncharacterized protein